MKDKLYLLEKEYKYEYPNIISKKHNILQYNINYLSYIYNYNKIIYNQINNKNDMLSEYLNEKKIYLEKYNINKLGKEIQIKNQELKKKINNDNRNIIIDEISKNNKKYSEIKISYDKKIDYFTKNIDFLEKSKKNLIKTIKNTKICKNTDTYKNYTLDINNLKEKINISDINLNTLEKNLKELETKYKSEKNLLDIYDKEIDNDIIKINNNINSLKKQNNIFFDKRKNITKKELNIFFQNYIYTNKKELLKKLLKKNYNKTEEILNDIKNLEYFYVKFLDDEKKKEQEREEEDNIKYIEELYEISNIDKKIEELDKA